MDQGILVKAVERGDEFVREFDKFTPVQAAFWLKESDEDQYYLYIVADGIGGAGSDGYREVARLSSRFESPFFDTFRIKLIRPDRPLGRAVIELNEQFPVPTISRLGPQMLGGEFVNDMYLYPSLHPVPANSAVGQP